MSAPKKSMWWQAGPFEQWVQEVLISVLVPEGASVCELMCGSGKALGKWQRAKLGQYVGVDPQEHAINEAKQRWASRGRSFPARFCVADPYLRALEEILEADRKFDAVSCFGKMQACFAREATARMLLGNASARLNDGGYFFGFLPDSSHIWTKAQEQLLESSSGSVAPSGNGSAGAPDRSGGDISTTDGDGKPFALARELYTLTFRDDTFPVFGCSYELRLAGQPTSSGRKEYLVHFPTLINIARECGLEMVSISNFKDFFDDYRGLFSSMLVKLQVLETERDRSLDKQQRELIELYTIFIFKKATGAVGD